MIHSKIELDFWLAFSLLFSVLCLSIFYYPYPPGIDLPQHAQMLHMFTDYITGAEPLYRKHFELQLFTPYILVYLVGLPLCQLFGAIIAVKILVVTGMLLLVLGIRRWLIAVKGDPWLSLTGFVTGFGYCFLWGFLPLYFSLGIGFFLLASVNEYFKSEDRTFRKQIEITTWGVLLSACHGMTFIFFLALAFLRTRTIKKFTNLLLCLGPGIIFVSQWILVKYSHRTNFSPDIKAVQPSRLEALLGGLFSAYPTHHQILAGVLIIAVIFLTLRFRVPQNSGVFDAILLSLIIISIAPTSTFSTWLVSQRFAGILHIFLPLCFWIPRFGEKAKYSVPIFIAAILSVQILFIAKVSAFNSELSGLTLVSRSISPNSDIRSAVMRGEDSSRAFGKDALSQSAAWISAERGRFLENDSSFYIQMPLQKKAGAKGAIHYRYLITAGSNSSESKKAMLLVTQNRARLVARSLPWAVYEMLE